MLDNISQYRLVLASNSPRRRELLAGLGLHFTVRTLPGVSEAYPPSLPAADIPVFIAREKAEANRATMAPDELLLTADTVVIVDGEVLGKPADEADARRMLRLVSGRTHQVVTGVCLMGGGKTRSFGVCTDVTFRELSAEEIDYYVDNFHPMDKAGAYGIQEWIGYVGVTGLRGSYFNVMGLPVQRIFDELKKF